MRSHILTGTGSPAYRGTLRGLSPFGTPSRRIGETDLAAVAQVLAAVTNALSWVRNLFTIGPGYDAANGGEVRRQLESLGDLGKPYVNPYLYYLKTYFPDVWNSGDIWDAPGYAHRSRFKDAYQLLLDAGLPSGALVDRNMVPLGLQQAQEAVNQAQTVASGPQPPTPAEMSALNILAMQVAGMQGAAVAAQAAATVATLRPAWQLYVNATAQLWAQADANTTTATDTGAGGGGATPQQAGIGGDAMALAVGAGLVFLIANN